MITLGDPFRCDSRLRRLLRVSHFHGERRNSKLDEAVLVAAHEPIPLRFGIGLHFEPEFLRCRANVLSESYLYTSEAIADSFDHLHRGGILAAQFGEFDYNARPNRTTRYVATARKALAERGVRDPSRHILVVTTTTEGASALSTVLVKETPFTPAQVDRVVTGLGAVPGAKLRYAPGHPVKGESVSDLATIPNSKLGSWYDSYPYDVRPVTDDAPFFWHFAPYGDVISNFSHPIRSGDAGVVLGSVECLSVILVLLSWLLLLLIGRPAATSQ